MLRFPSYPKYFIFSSESSVKLIRNYQSTIGTLLFILSKILLFSWNNLRCSVNTFLPVLNAVDVFVVSEYDEYDITSLATFNSLVASFSRKSNVGVN